MTSTLTQTGTTAGAFDWDVLTPPVDAPAATYAVGTTINPLEVPENLRKWSEESLRDSVAAIKTATDKGNKAESVPPQWKLLALPTVDMAEAGLKLMRRYAQYRPDKEIPFYVAGSPTGQITLRGAVVQYASKEDVAKDGAKPESTRKGLKLCPVDPATGEAVAPGVYIRYAAKPLEVRKPKTTK